MKRVAALVVLALVVVPSADAKTGTIELCGPAGCQSVSSHALVDALLPSFAPRFVGPPPLAPYYEIRSETLSPNPERAYFVPSAGVVRADFATGRPEWMKAGSGAATALQNEMPDLEPWPAPSISSAVVDTTAAADPEAYAALFDDFPAALAPPGGTRRFSIVVRSAIPSPWTDGYNRLEYVPGLHLLRRSEGWVRIPAAVAERVERDVGLVPAGGVSSPPWAIGAGLGAALALAAAAVFALWHRPRRGRARAV